MEKSTAFARSGVLESDAITKSKSPLFRADQKVVKGHIHNLKFDAQAIGNLLSQGYVKTGDGVHAVDLGMELEGGIVGAGAEDNLPGSFDLSQTAGLFRGCGASGAGAGLASAAELAGAGALELEDPHAARDRTMASDRTTNSIFFIFTHSFFLFWRCAAYSHSGLSQSLTIVPTPILRALRKIS